MKAITCNYDINVNVTMSWNEALSVIRSVDNLHLAGVNPPEDLKTLKQHLQGTMRGFAKNFNWNTE